MGKGWAERLGSAWDRTWDIGEAVGEFIAGGQSTTVIGASGVRLPAVRKQALNLDVATAAKDEKDYDGWVDAILKSAGQIGATKLNQLIGPEGVGGQIVEGLPETPVRDVGNFIGRNTLKPAFIASEDVFQEGISQPLATILLVLTSDEGIGAISKYDDMYRLADSISWGQALAIGLGQIDPFDEAQMAEFAHSDFYRYASGIADGTGRFFLDPTIIGGKAVVALKASKAAVKAGIVVDAAQDIELAAQVTSRGQLAKQLAGIAGTTDDLPTSLLNDIDGKELRTAVEKGAASQPGIDRIFNSNRNLRDRFKTRNWAKVDEIIGSMEGTTSQRITQIQDRFFHDNPDGSVFASFLGQAKNTAEREQVMRILHGDFKSLAALKESNIVVGQELQDTVASLLLVDRRASNYDRILGAETKPLMTDYRDYLRAKAQEAQAQLSRQEKLVESFATLPEQMHATVLGGVRTSIKRSNFYQATPLGRGVATVFNMTSKNMIDVSGQAPESANEIRRWLQAANTPFDELEETVGAYSSALNPIDRFKIVEQMQDRAISRLATEHGVSVDEMNDLIMKAQEMRATARGILKSRTYSADMRPSWEAVDANGEVLSFHGPLSMTQTADLAPLIDIAKTRWMFGKVRERVKDLPGGDMMLAGSKMSVDLMDGFLSIWKPAALLRPGWTVRVVFDEQLRFMAKFGAMTQMKGAARGVPGLASDEFQAMRDFGRKLRDYGATTPREYPTPEINGVVGKAIKALDDVENSTGYGEFAVNGFKVNGAWGPTADTARMRASQVSSAKQMDTLFGHDEAGQLIELRKKHASWVTVSSDRSDHLDQWADILNHQVAQDPVLMRFVDGMTPEQAKDWLMSADGLEYATNLGFESGEWSWRGTATAWAEEAKAMVDNLVMRDQPESAAIIEALHAKSKVAPKFLDDLVPQANRPSVHGPLLEEHVVGPKSLGQSVRGAVDSAFEILGKYPTDNLSRMPFFEASYHEYMTRALKDFKVGQLTKTELANLEQAGARWALSQTKKYMYELGESSQFGQMLRHLSVFFNAQQEIMTRWTGLAVENPTFLARARQFWNAPNKADLIYTDPETGEDSISFRLPSWADGAVSLIPGMQDAIDSQGTVRVSKKGLVGITSGFPSGPLVNYGLSKVAEWNPDLESSALYDFMLPYGVTENIAAAITPTTIRRGLQFMGVDMNKRERGYLQARIMQTKMVQMQMGDIPMMDLNDPAVVAEFTEDVQREAQAMLRLKAVVGVMFVTPLTFDSPYQPYFEYYRSLQEQQRADEASFKDDPLADEKIRNADDIFLEEYGPEFFALTQSLSKNNTGIPATADGEEFIKDWAPLLNSLELPEMGGLVFGTDGGSSTDEYLSSVARRRQRTPVRPGSDTMQQETYSLDEFVEQPQRRLGWIEYTRMADMVDAVRMERGLPNLNVKGAKDLRELKSAITDDLSVKYPAWRADFDDRDAGKWGKKIRDLWRIAEDDKAVNRPSIEALHYYLTYRESVLSAMTDAQIADINSTKATPLRKNWEDFVGSITADPSFSRLYHRWLDNDPMSVDTMRKGS